MSTKVLKFHKHGTFHDAFGVPMWVECLMVAASLALSLWVFGGLVFADNFSDLLYTSSFRGALSWVQKVDWMGGILQAAISIGSIIAASFMIIQVMASFIVLSARSIWEEVHELKTAGQDTEMYDFGVVGMAKTWAKGKSGSGLDAIIGFFLIIAPDVMKYSYFSEKSHKQFDADITMGQFALKIFLDVFISLFIIAMAFNGTMVKAWAVSIDALGTLAEHCVSVNYSGYINDLVSQGTGYKFTYGEIGTEEGDLKQRIASDLYGKAISKCRGLTAAQYEAMGNQIEAIIEGNAGSNVTQSSLHDHIVGQNGVLNNKWNTSASTDTDIAKNDRLMASVDFNIVTNSSGTLTGNEWLVSLSDIMANTGAIDGAGEVYFHVFFKQVQISEGVYYDVQGK